jgi:hypothetical protein
VVIDSIYNAFGHFNSHIVETEVSRSSLCLVSLELSFDSKESIQCMICDPVCFLYFAPAETQDYVIRSHRYCQGGREVWFFRRIRLLCVTLSLKHFLCKTENLEKHFRTHCTAVQGSDSLHKGFCMRGGRFRPKVLKSTDQISRSEKGNIHLYAVVGDRNTVDITVELFKSLIITQNKPCVRFEGENLV